MPAPILDLNSLATQDIAKNVLTGFNFFKEAYPGLQKMIDEIEKQVKGLQGVSDTHANLFKGLDSKVILDEINRLKAAYDNVKKRIQSNKSGFYIPGLEDEADRFSIARAAIAVKTKRWDSASFEKAVFDEAAKKAGNVFGVDSMGGYFIPDQVIADVITAIYTRSIFINLSGEGVTRLSVLDGLVGSPVKIPKFNGGMIAYWIGEDEKYVESAVKTGNIQFTPKKLGLLTRLTDEMRRFQGYGFENLMRQDLIRAAAKKLDATVLYGKGTENEPAGLMKMKGIRKYSAELHAEVFDKAGSNPVPNADGTGTALTGAGGELNFDDFMNMQGVLEDQDIDVDTSFSTVSAPRTFRKLQQLKVRNFSGQTDGQPYLIGVPTMTEERLRGYIGDFDKSTQIKSNNTAGQSLGWTPADANDKLCADTVGGNWSEMVFGRWSGLEVVDDGGNGEGFIKDETLIKFRMYGDLANRRESAFVVCPDAIVRR